MSTEVKSSKELAFTQWWLKEVPAGTIIGDPLWWVPRILKAVGGVHETDERWIPISERRPDVQEIWDQQVSGCVLVITTHGTIDFRYYKDVIGAYNAAIRDEDTCYYTHWRLPPKPPGAALKAAECQHLPGQAEWCPKCSAAKTSDDARTSAGTKIPHTPEEIAVLRRFAVEALAPEDRPMAMLPNKHHPGLGCSCGECLHIFPPT